MKTNKWKMSLLVWSAMFPFSTAMNYILAELPFTAHWPLVMRTFCLTCLIVPYMVFGAFPFLNHYFRKWLQSAPPTVRESPLSSVAPGQKPGFRNETSQTDYRATSSLLQQTGLASE